MTQQEIDSIECAIRHIQSSLDVDPWAMDIAVAAMKKELKNSTQPQRWIPCSERLPEEYEDIIVTYVDDEETRIIPVNYGKGTWYDCIFDTALNPIKVIAWMPLPTPYREEGGKQ